MYDNADGSICFGILVSPPFKGDKAEVEVNKLKKNEPIIMWFLTIIITVIFYVILRAFNTKNIIPSTISVTTSFIAVYLTFRRSSFYAIGYATNDIVLIILWTLPTIENIFYLFCNCLFYNFSRKRCIWIYKLAKDDSKAIRYNKSINKECRYRQFNF